MTPRQAGFFLPGRLETVWERSPVEGSVCPVCSAVLVVEGIRDVLPATAGLVLRYRRRGHEDLPTSTPPCCVSTPQYVHFDVDACEGRRADVLRLPVQATIRRNPECSPALKQRLLLVCASCCNSISAANARPSFR
jgi:hypothetical protein